jgi:hypothetical protein
MKFRLPQPFCAPNCPRMSGKCDRWHKSCFRCPNRKVLLAKGNWQDYHCDQLTGHLEPIDCYVVSLFVRYDKTIIFYSNNRKHLRYVKDILLNTLLTKSEQHSHYLQIDAFCKIIVQIAEELCK